MKLKLKYLLNLNVNGQSELLAALGRVRKLPLPAFRAYEVIKLTRAVEAVAGEVLTARNEAIKKHGKVPEGGTAATVEPGTPEMASLLEELKALAEREESVPLTKKIPLPADVMISAEDLTVLETLFELEER